MVEAKVVGLEGVVEGFFAGMAEGRMADVVGQREGFGQLRVQAQGNSQSAGDLGHFQGVGKAAAEVVGGWIDAEAGEDLGFAGEAAKGARMQDASGVAGKGRAIGMRRFGMGAAGQFRIRAAADGDSQGAKQLPDWIPACSSKGTGRVHVWLYRRGLALRAKKGK